MLKQAHLNSLRNSMSKELWDELEKKIGKPCSHYFRANIEVSLEDKKSSFEFAKKMSMENKHNPDSFASGNEKNTRTPMEIFRDAFQGKIAEFAFCNYVKLHTRDNNNLKPDLDCWVRGEWEDTDFIIVENGQQFTCSIKSTKGYGKLLLLERNRYDDNGFYLEPSKSKIPVKHDFFYLIRVQGVEKNKNYSAYTEKDINAIQTQFMGCITHDAFKELLKIPDRILPAGTPIGNEPLKVDNIWVCATELKIKGIS